MEGSAGCLAGDEAAATQLMHKPNTLRVVNPLIGKPVSPWQEKVNGLRYALDPNQWE